MTRIRFHALPFAILVAVAGLAVPPAAPARAAGTKVSISYSEKVGDELPLWIADDAGYFKKRGIDATVRYLPARQGIPALLTNEIQIAAIGGPDVLSAAAAGAKVKYFATLSPVLTFQFWARPDYASAQKLKGQRVGVTSTTGSLYAGTVIALRKLGLKPSDVAITPLGNVPNVDSALIAGSIAAASSHPPATYQFQQHKFVKLVDLAEERIPAVNTGLVATDSYIAAHPKLIENMAAAIIEALHREKTDKAYAEKEIRAHMGVKSQAVLDFTYDFYAKHVAPDVPMPEAVQFTAAQHALAVTNPKVKNVNIAAIFDQSFVKKAMAQQDAK